MLAKQQVKNLADDRLQMLRHEQKQVRVEFFRNFRSTMKLVLRVRVVPILIVIVRTLWHKEKKKSETVMRADDEERGQLGESYALVNSLGTVVAEGGHALP